MQRENDKNQLEIDDEGRPGWKGIKRKMPAEYLETLKSRHFERVGGKKIPRSQAINALCSRCSQKMWMSLGIIPL